MNWEDRIRHLAAKHGFETEATEFLAHAIRDAGGRFAQWRHPQLGGFGHWMPGITTLTPREPALEKRLDELCLDLLTLLQENHHAQTPGEDGLVWWPKTLGLQPNPAGAQDKLRYAYFGDSRRLAVDRGDGQVTVYDTGDHQIHGVAPAPGTSGQWMFQSQTGEVGLDTLTVVEPPGA